MAGAQGDLKAGPAVEGWAARGQSGARGLAAAALSESKR